jgi:hypothetical protein
LFLFVLASNLPNSHYTSGVFASASNGGGYLHGGHHNHMQGQMGLPSVSGGSMPIGNMNFTPGMNHNHMRYVASSTGVPLEPMLFLAAHDQLTHSATFCRISSTNHNSHANPSSGPSSRGPSPHVFSIVIDHILSGGDPRTTIMLRNIPNKYTRDMLLEDLDMQFRGSFDFLYLPMDFNNDCNMGYAFLNFIAPSTIVPFYNAFHGRRWNRFNSEKIAEVTYGKIQGKYALIEHFKKSNVMLQNTSYRPLIFYSTGPMQGLAEPFPVVPSIHLQQMEMDTWRA